MLSYYFFAILQLIYLIKQQAFLKTMSDIIEINFEELLSDQRNSTFSSNESYWQKYKYKTSDKGKSNQQCFYASQSCILIHQQMVSRDLFMTVSTVKSASTLKVQCVCCYNNILVKSKSNQYISSILYKKVNLYNTKMPNNFCRFIISKNGIIELKGLLFNSNKLWNRKLGISLDLSLLIQQVKSLALMIFPLILENMNLLSCHYQKIISDKNPNLTKSDIEYTNIIKYIKASYFADQFNNLDDNDERDHQVLNQLNNHSTNWVVDPILDLYTYNDFEYLSQSFRYSDYKVSLDQIQKFKQSLSYPKIKNGRIKNDSSFVFNYIRVNNPQLAKAIPHKQGGFSIILLIYLSFNCIQTGCALRQIYDGSCYTGQISKHLCIKVPKNRKNQDRLSRQSQILVRLKGLVCPYLLKYYQSNQNQFSYRQKLMADAYSSPTLDQYFQLHQNCLSMATKLLLFIQLAQALRFLKNYKIIHMDLKPNNIFITKLCLLKVFDFGQAYHPQVFKQGYKPGYTKPYTAPQYFKDLYNNLSNKIDCFAMGVLMLQAFVFRSLDTKTEKLAKQFMVGKYFQRFLFVTQELESYCERKSIYPLFNLIIRLLDTSPKMRPNPSWTIIALREILSQM